jgi:hypothetical protein
MTREAIAQAPKQRPKRTTLGTKTRLGVANPDPNYEYRFVNDTRDRVEIFKQNGWEVAPDKDVKVGDSRVENPSAIGSASRVPVGLVGELPGHAVVMRIPKQWYEEDQKAKANEIARLENTMKDPSASDTYGKIEITR